MAYLQGVEAELKKEIEQIQNELIPNEEAEQRDIKKWMHRKMKNEKNRHCLRTRVLALHRCFYEQKQFRVARSFYYWNLVQGGLLRMKEIYKRELQSIQSDPDSDFVFESKTSYKHFKSAIRQEK